MDIRELFFIQATGFYLDILSENYLLNDEFALDSQERPIPKNISTQMPYICSQQLSALGVSRQNKNCILWI